MQKYQNMTLHAKKSQSIGSDGYNAESHRMGNLTLTNRDEGLRNSANCIDSVPLKQRIPTTANDKNSIRIDMKKNQLRMNEDLYKANKSPIVKDKLESKINSSRKTYSSVKFQPLGMSQTTTHKFKPGSRTSNYNGNNQVRLATEGENQSVAERRQELNAQKVY